MFRTISSTLYGLLVDDGQLAIGALVALAITWAIGYAGGVVANLYRAGAEVRRRVSSAHR
ncbi:MAG: hypothetical protein AUH39_03455 [Chloroflexi bacterium 13_1_40CM_67_9]|nr:MAG: hypothetical protein AUH39_03455 [Chloroflexi bacterium 13_1_40CM_67_9]